MNALPLISIITVVYNGERYLEQTIESVIHQTYTNIEYIIIDGGSTDGTLNIIKNYEAHITRWVSEPDKGLYDAMNKGIRMANGVLIGMINSDDWYELDAVETVVKAFKSNPLKTIFHADRYNVLQNGEREIRRFNPSVFKFKYYGMTYNHPSMFIAKTEYDKHLYNPKLRAHSDYQFVLESFMHNKKSFKYIPECVVNYRLDGISSNMHFWQSSKDVFKVRREAGFTLAESIFAFIFMRMITVLSKLKI